MCLFKSFGKIFLTLNMGLLLEIINFYNYNGDGMGCEVKYTFSPHQLTDERAHQQSTNSLFSLHCHCRYREFFFPFASASIHIPHDFGVIGRHAKAKEAKQLSGVIVLRDGVAINPLFLCYFRDRIYPSHNQGGGSIEGRL